MKQRLISLAVIVPIIILALIFGGLLLNLLVLAVAVASIFEITKALSKAQIGTMPIFNYAYALIADVLICFGLIKYILPLILVMTMIIMSIPVISKRFTVKEAFATVGVLIYPTTLILTLNINAAYGTWYVLGAVLSSVIVDTAAFFFGNYMGKTKLCPEVSPHKTVAGAIGGAVCCAVLFTVYGVLVDTLAFGHAFNIGRMFVWFDLAVLCGIFAQFGDLTASAVKRYCGIKDYSNLIPGHGGIMDRLDSVMFTSTLVFLFLVMGII